MPIWYGPLANNGKSTLSEALRCVLGSDYSTSLDVEFLIGDRRQGSDEYYYAQLKGMRHVLFEEPAEGATLRSKALKAIVDNRREFTGRHPHGRPFKFPLTWKSHVVTNHKPHIKATDAGTWRRLLMVPFNVTIDPDKDKKDFKNVLFEEGSGILNRLIDACKRWQANGQLFIPKSVRAATDDFRSASDVIGQFIAEKCVTGSADFKTRSSELYDAYKAYMIDNSDLGEAQSSTAFGRYMGERFKKDTAKRYLGIGLRK
jgi:putative DNA primase/helicase